jgi:hypothetical protein
MGIEDTARKLEGRAEATADRLGAAGDKVVSKWKKHLKWVALGIVAFGLVIGYFIAG